MYLSLKAHKVCCISHDPLDEHYTLTLFISTYFFQKSSHYCLQSYCSGNHYVPTHNACCSWKFKLLPRKSYVDIISPELFNHHVIKLRYELRGAYLSYNSFVVNFHVHFFIYFWLKDQHSFYIRLLIRR